MNGLISIIIPVYNVEKYLRKCIDSVLSQTYKNLEIILVDDGSPDNCGKICDEYAEKDARIRVIHKENGGVSSARNAALDVAQGEYIGFVDADDYVASDMYEKLVKHIDDQDIDISICGYCEVYDTGVKEVSICNEERKITGHEGIIGLIEDVYGGYLWNKLYRKNLFDDERFSNLIVMEDALVNHRLFKKTNRIRLLKSSLYYYVRREDSVTMKKQIKKKCGLVPLSYENV